MQFTNRLIYLVYYLKNADKKKISIFLTHSSKITGKSKIGLLADAIYSVFKYNTSITDYFYFRFYSLKKSERLEWAGTGFMYEYQLKMNPKGTREVLENKIMFLQNFRSFVKREFHTLDEIRVDNQLVEKMLTNSSGRLVLKGSRGQVGAEVDVIACNAYSPIKLIDYMAVKKYDLIEEYVIQHSSLLAMSPSGLNTVRLFTQLHKGEVNFLGARLRISVNSPVDNMAAGNLAAPIDINTGVIDGSAVYSDITKEEQTIHPITGIAITGFVIPYWKEIIEFGRKAALHTPENRSVGWDIAITNEGPELIEGNHNWCKLLWQLPVKKGLKSVLVRFL